MCYSSWLRFRNIVIGCLKENDLSGNKHGQKVIEPTEGSTLRDSLPVKMAAADLLLWLGRSWRWDSPYRAMNIDFTSLLPLIFIWRMENWSICFKPCRQAAFSNSASVLWTGGEGVRMGLRISERTLGSLLGAVGTNLFLNKEPTASLPTGLGLSNVMALYLRFLIIWNNNEFSAPAKNSDWVQARGTVDQSESFLSFMWTWKKESKCLRSERSTWQNVPQIPNSQRIFERMVVISSQFCFTTKHCFLLQGLWTGWLYIHMSVWVWQTHGHMASGWFVGVCMAFWYLPPRDLASYQSAIMLVSRITFLSLESSHFFSKRPAHCLVFYFNLREMFLFPPSLGLGRALMRAWCCF